MVRGDHDVKVGLGVRANQMNVKTQGFGDGYWIYSGAWAGEPMADLVLGLPVWRFTIRRSREILPAAVGNSFVRYVEDDWKVNKSLTINLGLAWALVTPITEAHDRQADFNPFDGQFLIAGQGASASAGVQMDKTALEPRIGVAWKPFGSAKTAIRGGYAVFHDSSLESGAQGLWQNPPYYAESDSFAFTGGCTFATSACATSMGKPPELSAHPADFLCSRRRRTPASFTGTIQSQNLNFKQGRVQQFNINMEHQLPGQIVSQQAMPALVVLTFSSMAIISTCLHLRPVERYQAIRLAVDRTGSLSAFLTPSSRFPPSLTQRIRAGAHYNSLQIKAETKSSHTASMHFWVIPMRELMTTASRTVWEAVSAPRIIHFLTGKSSIGGFRRST